ncbi:XRE family transcriptional regulator [Labilibaculum euxinus]|uniref:Helix-turn-helix domain-containing protein n=1 Tax=Labilibaculum euxinus TaxID=2686357 RepID=A0A7M4D8J7_9BACT|nr:helix-turn-helix domain-containing protein [Labilibaculum euxinus]MBN2596357.1 LexA family transcriptional regulator [Marinifilaceae bacterium]MUP38976.1 helix-turn-helix domain-containing protein [Labilibaculum euxinus]MVB08181.1 helix-turn-helix domain-containing protein [Labilibaculum euxinus]|eukprot:TRINITY_DN7651_c0_g3_i1.p1 TRINITY_DN7651_c0_g3~~TRINITY_DN7651_c0_g3_i1.p1  ORF type:complete len:237 (-),score=-2.42 TRINITY_DN7651_c0_g3_i1:12-722(-)
MFFAENIKFLRQRRKKSQLSLAEQLDITRTTLAGYEKNVQPPFKVLIKFAEYFGVSIDALLRYNLAELSEFQLSQIEDGFDIDVTGKKLRLLTISVNKDGEENIEMVPLKAQAGYTNSYGDLEFIGSLPKFSLPFLPKDKTYRTFQIAGDSMLPIPEGAWVTASFIQNWEQIKDGTPCIIVTLEDGIVFKVVYKQLEKNQTLLLVSSNRNYKPYELPIKNVIEIWKFETFNGFEIE